MAKEKITISNTSPLIAFLQINKLFILKKLFKELLISNEVYQEISEKKQKEILNFEIKNGWLKKTKVEKLNIANLLDLGEASSISLALKYKNPLLIIDDMQGRTFAKNIGIHVTGTLGVLLFAKKKKIIPSVKSVINELQEYNLWFSNKLILSALKESGELP